MRSIATQTIGQSVPLGDTGTGARRHNTDIIFQMSRTLASANRYLAVLMAENGLAGLVPSHGSILAQLREADGPVTMAHLAEAIGKDPSTVTSLVRKLADNGYVRTERGVQDRRAVEVSLTPEGLLALPRIDEVSARIAEVLLADFSDAQLASAREQMVRMCEIFERAHAQEKQRAFGK